MRADRDKRKLLMIAGPGVFPIELTLDHTGPIARTAGDAAQLLEVLAGTDEPVLKELSQLSSRAVAAEIERRGHGKVSHKLVQRARVRLGLKD